MDGDVAQLVECLTGMPLTQVQFPSAARFFPPCQLAVQTLLCVSLHSSYRESNLNLPWVKSQWDNPVVKIKIKSFKGTHDQGLLL